MRLGWQLAGQACLAAAALTAQASAPLGRAEVLNPDLSGLHTSGPGPLLAWGSDATVWLQNSPGSGWHAASTPHHGRIRALVASATGLVAVGDQGLLMHSRDQGRHWQAAATTPEPHGHIADVACQGRRCLAIGDQGLLLHSDNGGQAWLAAPASSAASTAAAPSGALAHVRAAPDGAWWVADAVGHLWHGDPGTSPWRLLAHNAPTKRSGAPGAGPVSTDALAVDGQQLLVARSDGRLLAWTTDSGTPTLLHRAGRGSFTRLSPLPSAGSWVAIGTHGACAWRAGPAARWLPCQVPRQRLLRGLASSPDGRHWVVVGESGLLLHSSNQGRRWQPVQGLPTLEMGRHLEAVAWSPQHKGFVAVGTAGLVLHGQADGQRWQVAHQAPLHYVHDLVATRQPRDNAPAALLASLSYRQLARSEDGGRSWRSHRFDALQEPAFLFALHADPDTGSLVAAGGQGSVMVAPDGRHWRHESLGHGRDYLGLLALPDTPQVLLWGTGGVVLRVDSQTASWQTVPLPAKDPVYGAFHSPGGDAWLLGQAGLVLHSGDDGQTWQAQRIGPHTLRAGLALEEGRVLLVAGDGGTLWRAGLQPSADASRPRQTWLQVATPQADWRWLRRSADGRSLWLGGQGPEGGQLARSDDLGLSWHPVPLPSTATPRPPVYDAARGRWWMAGRDGSLLSSTDDGASWQAVATHTREHLKGLWVNPQDGSLLLYGARLVRWTPGANATALAGQEAP